MSTTSPIKDKKALAFFRDYYRDISPNPRNYTMIVMGLNTAFRIGDLLNLKWKDVCSADRKLREHICVEEQKTEKTRIVPINDALRQALESYWSSCQSPGLSDYLFPSSRCKSQPLLLSDHETLSRYRAGRARPGISAYQPVGRAQNIIEIKIYFF